MQFSSKFNNRRRSSTLLVLIIMSISMSYILKCHNIVLQLFTLDGTVSVDGESGSGTVNSGGGSGGLLLINSSSLFGRGCLTSHGGNGMSGSFGSHPNVRHYGNDNLV